MIEKWDITIPELTGDEVRSAYICLPEAYTRDINDGFRYCTCLTDTTSFLTVMPPTENPGD